MCESTAESQAHTCAGTATKLTEVIPLAGLDISICTVRCVGSDWGELQDLCIRLETQEVSRMTCRIMWLLLQCEQGLDGHCAADRACSVEGTSRYMQTAKGAAVAPHSRPVLRPSTLLCRIRRRYLSQSLPLLVRLKPVLCCRAARERRHSHRRRRGVCPDCPARVRGTTPAPASPPRLCAIRHRNALPPSRFHDQTVLLLRGRCSKLILGLPCFGTWC